MIPNEKACKAKSEGHEAKLERYEAKFEGQRLWCYLSVKILSALLRGKTSKHHGGFYHLNCLHSFATEKKLESH